MRPEPCFCGIDVGSSSTKAVILCREGSVVGRSIIDSGGDLAKAAENALAEALNQARIQPDALQEIVSTGYGRDSVRGRTKRVTEITCHARGAYSLVPHARSVIDIGGQDSKAISLSADGLVQKFEMNDKCAAGTGRFLEVTARTLGVDLDKIGRETLTADSPAKISSMCTVFAESEVISLLAQGESVPRILFGLCTSISRRIASLASRVGMEPELVMTGGVAKNEGVVKSIESLLGFPVTVPEDPQMVGALGAALIARDRSQKGRLESGS